MEVRNEQRTVLPEARNADADPAYSYASINWVRFKGFDLRPKPPLRTERTLPPRKNAGNLES